MALINANAELATKKNDLKAFSYLVKKLSISEFKEERASVVSKLTVWPGAERYAFSVFPVLLNACQVEQVDELRYLILIGLARMMDREPLLAKYNEQSLSDLKTSLKNDKRALGILGGNELK